MSNIALIWTPNDNLDLDTSFNISYSDSSYNLIRSSFTGFMGMPSIHQTNRSPYQNGRNYYSTNYDTRVVSFRIKVEAPDFNTLINMRQEISKYFSAVNGEGTLRFVRPNGEYYDLYCVNESEPLWDDMGHGDKTAFVTFILQSFDPFWFDPSENSYDMYLYNDGFKVPFSVPFSWGYYGLMDMENAGDVDTPVTITCTGPLTNPVITNNRTDEFISITKELSAGESIIINTSFDSPAVTYIDDEGTETNLFSAVSTDSTFWQLKPGTNEISLRDSTAIGDRPFIFEWYNKFTGV